MLPPTPVNLIYYRWSENDERGVSAMKGMMMKPAAMTRRTMMPMIVRHETMIRRMPNHNVHVITHHGTVMLGRRGRTK